ILLKILETANIPVSFLPRDDHLELMDQYTINNKRFIPIFIFIDDSGNEIGKCGTMAHEVEKLYEEMKASVPVKDHTDYAESFKQYSEKISKLFTQDDTYCVATYESIMKSMFYYFILPSIL